MDHVHFPYRSSSRLALMHVTAESGAWERQGLRVDYENKISREIDDSGFIGALNKTNARPLGSGG